MLRTGSSVTIFICALLRNQWRHVIENTEWTWAINHAPQINFKWHLFWAVRDHVSPNICRCNIALPMLRLMNRFMIMCWEKKRERNKQLTNFEIIWFNSIIKIYELNIVDRYTDRSLHWSFATPIGRYIDRMRKKKVTTIWNRVICEWNRKLIRCKIQPILKWY